MIRLSQIPPIVGVVIGVTFYEIANTFEYLIQPVFFPSLFRLLGLLIIIIFLRKAQLMRLPKSIYSVFSILMIWTIIMFLRGSLMGNFAPGSDTSIRGIVQREFLSPYGPFAFFIPFVALVNYTNNSLYYLKKLAVLLCMVALIMSFWERNEIANGMISHGFTNIAGANDSEMTVRHLIYALYPGFGIILLFLFLFNYVKGKVAFLFPIAIIIFFLSNAIGGGRSQTGLNLTYLFLFFFLVIRYPVNKKKEKGSSLAFLILAAAFVFFLLYLFNNTTVFDYVLERAFGDKTLGGEFINDSRNTLRDDMFRDFNNHPLDWIWGRGVNGAYRTQHLSDGGWRMWMEWGYLYIILKGGVVYLFLIVYCMLHAAFMGFFRSKNALSKCLAVMCIVYMLNFVSAGSEPQFSTLFLLSWISFGFLERTQVRMLSDDVIYGYFNNKNYNPQ